MTTYVLVHGGFSGGWVWRTVASHLRAAGHDVFTPTLTGLGERAHLAHPEINLDTHIQDVIGVFACEELSQVVLIGHSSGSMVVTGVAEKIPDQIGHLVYLDTIVPTNGQSWLELLGPDASNYLVELAETYGDGWRIPVPLKRGDPPRRQPHPLKTVTQPINVTNPSTRTIPRTFIYCTEKSKTTPLAVCWPHIAQAATLAKRQGWRYRELPTGHGCMRTMPRAVSQLLFEIASLS